MAERSNAAVLKTVEVKASRGSNPFLSATQGRQQPPFFVAERKNKKELFWFARGNEVAEALPRLPNGNGKSSFNSNLLQFVLSD